eukprot:TRINITY_DN10409_c0_g1_i1.p1 TRINITY_DN10409_c0_g1~~TRINITY_DN10409_c0_g1_i1.p1  ORF type:complete len:446 (+),score=65.57 TRINITY_DN10409_c0_g1_i1:201-1538(+)
MEAKTAGEFLRDFHRLAAKGDSDFVRHSLSLLRRETITDEDLQQLLLDVMQSPDDIQDMCMEWLYTTEDAHKRDVAISLGFAEVLFNRSKETRTDKDWHNMYIHLLGFWLTQTPPCRQKGFYKFVYDPLVDWAVHDPAFESDVCAFLKKYVMMEDFDVLVDTRIFSHLCDLLAQCLYTPENTCFLGIVHQFFMKNQLSSSQQHHIEERLIPLYLELMECEPPWGYLSFLGSSMRNLRRRMRERYQELARHPLLTQKEMATWNVRQLPILVSADEEDEKQPEGMPHTARQEVLEEYYKSNLSLWTSSFLSRELIGLICKLCVEGYREGQIIDAMDRGGVWCAGEVAEVSDSGIKVHFTGFAKAFAEWFDIPSLRIAPAFTYTICEVDEIVQAEGLTEATLNRMVESPVLFLRSKEEAKKEHATYGSAWVTVNALRWRNRSKLQDLI